MFAPEGYTPLSELWQRFVSKHGYDLRKAALKRYDVPARQKFTEFGSPADFVEEAFIRGLDGYPIYLWSIAAEPISVQAFDQTTGFRLLDRMSVIESYFATVDRDEAAMNSPFLSRVGSPRFAPWNDVKSFGTNPWRAVYLDGEHKDTELGHYPFHTLPITFIRHRFMVPDPLPPWTEDAIDDLFIGHILPFKGGWCYGLLDADAVKWRKTTLRSNWACGFDPDAKDTPPVGRPRKQERALNAYMKHYPDGHTGPLKAVLPTIENECGCKIDLRTLQRALTFLRQNP